MPKSDERFARQYRYEPPPKFPLASPCSGIVRYLSGSIMYALPQSPLRETGQWCKFFSKEKNYPTLLFRYAFYWVLFTLILADMLDSLVRVSRRVGRNPLTSNSLTLLRKNPFLKYLKNYTIKDRYRPLNTV